MASLEEVDVREVIQPNSFFVTPIRRLNPRDEVARILDIEAGLPDFANNPDLEVTRSNIDKLKKKSIVAVKVEDNWVRASVTDILLMRWESSGNPKQIELDVYLIDWGYHVKIVDIGANVRLLPENSIYSQVGGLASQVTIDCLVALTIEANEEMRIVHVPTEKWSEKALELVRDLVDDASETYLEFQTRGGKRFGSDIHFVLELRDCHVKDRYGDFKPVFEDCLTPEGRISLKNLLIAGQFAVLVDPENSPLKKEFRFETNYHDNWESIATRPRATPRRDSAPLTFPEVPDAQEELERQRRHRELRRKQRDEHKRLARRTPKVVTREDKIVRRADGVNFSIRELVDRKDGIERPKAVVYQPTTIGRGDMRKIRRDRVVDTFDEQIGLKRERSSTAVIEEGQFSDADDGPFWEDESTKFAKTGDINRKLQNPPAVPCAVLVGQLYNKKTDTKPRKLVKDSAPMSVAAPPVSAEKNPSPKDLLQSKKTKFFDIHDVLDQRQKERENLSNRENSSLVPSHFRPGFASTVKQDCSQEEVLSANFSTAQEPPSRGSTAGACRNTSPPDAATATGTKPKVFSLQPTSRPVADTSANVPKNDIRPKDLSPPKRALCRETRVEKIRDPEVPKENCASQSSTTQSRNVSVVGGKKSRLYLQDLMMASCDAVGDRPAEEMKLEVSEIRGHTKADAAQSGSDNQVSEEGAKPDKKEDDKLDKYNASNQEKPTLLGEENRHEY